MLEERRKRRDQNQYNQIAYKDRQEAEEPLLKILEKKAINVNNLDDKLDEAVSFVVDTVINFNEKVKNK
jgi:hypothetical protein